MSTKKIFESLGFSEKELSTGSLEVYSPIDGSLLGKVQQDTEEQVDAKIITAHEAFQSWRSIPAPKRGELIRLLGDELRHNKEALGELVTIESGKLLQEGYGEVQEMIDICDFAVGLSRQLYGLTISSERPEHKMREIWQPLGVVGVISAFNFPVAVWAWNFAIAIVCGNSVVWKPSEKTPITALVCAKLFKRAVERFEGDVPEGLSQVIIGEKEVGEQLVDNQQVPLVSATGSTAMGRSVGPRVAARFGKSILELGGNNAIIVAPSADLEMALRAIVFGAVGTCGQRCTSTRRLLVHDSVYDELLPRLKAAYDSIAIGSPLEEGVLVGPLIDKNAFDAMQETLKNAVKEGGKVHGGERVLADISDAAYYIKPALVEMSEQTDVVYSETFAPILYVMKYSDYNDALQLHNEVPQGLSSAVFTNNIIEAEKFTSEIGSDCGIANINIGTSGAEIGGAFGGEKETGGGRESGSDAWKAYMRRMTSTVNYSKDLPLAQGIKFNF